MSEELREAAARLTANCWETYIGSPEDRDWLGIASNILTDGRLIANAYLAANPADDDELVTTALAQRFGFKPIGEECRLWHAWHVPLAMIDFREEKPILRIGSASTGWHIITESATRGHVRRLLAALGVELKAT